MLEAATVGDRGCNRRRSRLQPWPEANTGDGQLGVLYYGNATGMLYYGNATGVLYYGDATGVLYYGDATVMSMPAARGRLR